MSDEEIGQEKIKRPQANINFSSEEEKQRTLQPFEAWKRDKNGGKGQLKDWIVWMSTAISNADDRATVVNELQELGLLHLAELYLNRRKMDDRLLEQIADIVKQSRDTAREEVRSEIEGLKKDKENLQVSLDEKKAEIARLKDEAAQDKKAYAEKILAMKHAQDAQREAYQADVDRQRGIATKASEQAIQTKEELLAAKDREVELHAEIVAIKASFEEQIARHKAELAQWQQDRESGQAKFEQEIRSIRIEKESAEKTANDLEGILQKAQDNLKALHAQIETAREEKASLKEQLAASTAQTESLKEQVNGLMELLKIQDKKPETNQTKKSQTKKQETDKASS